MSHAYFNMLGHLFSLRELVAADHVVVLEDDLLPAPDFVHYFTQAACLVDRDPTVYAVSAWNDNGHWGRAADEARVFRGEVRFRAGRSAGGGPVRSVSERSERASAAGTGSGRRRGD